MDRVRSQYVQLDLVQIDIVQLDQLQTPIRGDEPNMTGWLVDLLVLLGVIAIVAIAGWFVFSQMELPDPLKKILLVVLVIIAAIVAIAILLQLRSGAGGLKLGKSAAAWSMASIPESACITNGRSGSES